MKKIIRLTESDIYNLVKRVISEQNTTNNEILTDEEAVKKLNYDINKIISKQQTNIFSQITLKWSSGALDEDIIFSVLLNNKYTKDKLVIKNIADYKWSTKLKYINFGNVPISKNLLTSVYENKNYQTLFIRHPEVKSQVDAAFVNCYLVGYTATKDGNDPVFTISARGELSNGKGYNKTEIIPFGQVISNDGGSGSNSFSIIVKKKLLKKNTLIKFEIGNSMLYLNKFNIIYNSGGEPETKPIDDIASITLNNKGTEPFKYDKLDLTKESIRSIDKFVDYIKDINKTYDISTYNKYVDILKKSPINVLAYASIDGDSNANEQGTYPDCRGYGNGTRGQYNLCLSQARADKIAKILNEKLPEIGSFVGKGMGETKKFGPAWTKEKPTTNTETLPNRRFEVILPTVTLNIPK